MIRPAGSRYPLLLAVAIALAAVVAFVLWRRHDTVPAAPASALAPAAAAPLPQEAATTPEPTPAPAAETLLLAQSAYAACEIPAEPAPPPDGASATREQMLAAHEAEQRYDRAVNAYVNCVDVATARLTEQFNTATQDKLDAVRHLGLTVHNAAIEREEAVVDTFNRQLRVYKARKAP